MAIRTIRVALLLSILSATGCGTVANLVRQRPGAGGVVPFGGVKQDMDCIQKAANGDFGVRGHGRTNSDHYPQRALMLACAADLPFSIIGDILTWPYAATYTFINEPIPMPPVIIATSSESDVPSMPAPTKPDVSTTMPIPVTAPGVKAPAPLPRVPISVEVSRQAESHWVPAPATIPQVPLPQIPQLQPVAPKDIH